MTFLFLDTAYTTRTLILTSNARKRLLGLTAT